MTLVYTSQDFKILRTIVGIKPIHSPNNSSVMFYQLSLGRKVVESTLLVYKCFWY